VAAVAAARTGVTEVHMGGVVLSATTTTALVTPAGKGVKKKKGVMQMGKGDKRLTPLFNKRKRESIV
jgi:hypothetical protein